MSWLTALLSGITSVCLITDTDSPVRIAWSTLKVVEWILVILISAGTLSPTIKQMIEKTSQLLWRHSYNIVWSQRTSVTNFTKNVDHEEIQLVDARN